MMTLFYFSWHIYAIGSLIAILLVWCIILTYYKSHYLRRRYLYNDRETCLLGKEKALLLGVIYAEQIHCYVNSLTTGLKKHKLDEILYNHWEVTDRETALCKLDWLLTSGDRMRYVDIYPFISQKEGDFKYAEYLDLNNHFLDNNELDVRMCMIDNLSEITKEMSTHIAFSFSPENMKRGVASWDAVRLVVLARICFDKGYITEQQAWNFISDAYDLAYVNYKNWKEVATGYIIGHSMYDWGDNESLDKIINLAEEAISNKESPWVNIDFKLIS